MTKEVESIIFDWGGVLIEDPRPGLLRYCAEAFGMPVEDYAETHDRFLEGFQKGLISEETFWDRIRRELNRPKPNQNSLWSDAFRSTYSPRAEVFSFASELHNKNYKIALLSNTEVPAMEFCRRLQYNMFDVLVFSCAEGALKPERKIYEVTLKRLGSRPEQAVLIDDKVQFVRGAQQAGLSGIVFRNLEQVKGELAELGVK